MVLETPERYGLFGLGEFGTADFGRPVPLLIAYSVPNGTLINTQILGKIVNTELEGNFIETHINGKILNTELNGNLIDTSVNGKLLYK